MGQTRTCSKSVWGGYSLQLYARAALAWTKKKRSLRNEKLKANRAKEQRKEMLRIRRENKKTENHEITAPAQLSKDGSEVTTMSWRAT